MKFYKVAVFFLVIAGFLSIFLVNEVFPWAKGVIPAFSPIPIWRLIKRRC